MTLCDCLIPIISRHIGIVYFRYAQSACFAVISAFTIVISKIPIGNFVIQFGITRLKAKGESTKIKVKRSKAKVIELVFFGFRCAQTVSRENLLIKTSKLK